MAKVKTHPSLTYLVIKTTTTSEFQGCTEYWLCPPHLPPLPNSLISSYYTPHMTSSVLLTLLQDTLTLRLLNSLILHTTHDIFLTPLQDTLTLHLPNSLILHTTHDILLTPLQDTLTLLNSLILHTTHHILLTPLQDALTLHLCPSCQRESVLDCNTCLVPKGSCPVELHWPVSSCRFCGTPADEKEFLAAMTCC